MPIAVADTKSYLLTDEVALVTGSSRGIGRAIALELASRGARIVVNYVSSEASAQKVVEEITEINPVKNGPSAIAVQADTSSVEDLKKLFETAKATFGKIDIVVSNAGREHWGHISKITPEDIDSVFNVNFKGQLLVAQQAYHHIAHGGRLILMSSIVAHARVTGSHYLYNASKAAVEALVRSLPVDFGDKRVTVNGIAPGGIKSDMYVQNAKHYLPGGLDMTAEEVEAGHAKMSPLSRVGVPEDIARVVAFLTTQDGAWMNGETLLIAGGCPGY